MTNLKTNSHYIITVKSVDDNVTKERLDYAFVDSDGKNKYIDFWSRDLIVFNDYRTRILVGAYDKLIYAIASLTSIVMEPKCENYLKELEYIAGKIWPGVSYFKFPENFNTTVVYKTKSGEVVDPDYCFKKDDSSYVYYPNGISSNQEIPVYRYELEDLPFRGHVIFTSKGLLENFLNNYKITLEDFIMNDKYIVFCDSTYYPCWDQLRNSPMFNNDNILDIYHSCIEVTQN